MSLWLTQTFIEPWTHVYFVKGVVGGSVVAVTCAVLGCYIILRKMAFIGDAMSHALLPGVGIGYLVMNAFFPGGFTAGGLLLGALLAAILTSVCISFLSHVGRIAEDTAIGIIYTGLFAAGVVILTKFQQYINIDLNHFFQGDIYGVAWPDMWLGAVIGAVLLGIIIMFYRQITLVSFDPTMAASIGLPTKLIHIGLTAMIALICVAGISMVGVIMIVGLLITPAALAYLFTDRLPRMMVLAAFFGVLSVILGLYFSEWVNASGGGAIMFMGFILFIVGLIVAPRYGLMAGWIRRRRMVPQSDREDVLKALFEKQTVEGIEHISKKRIRRALRMLAREGYLTTAGSMSSCTLTQVGEDEAAHILRSHQLWEGHFIAEGMSEEAAHKAAERLEHLHDRFVLDEFDDELEHPVYDAHGVEVPGEREVDEEAGEVLLLSLLRKGDAGVVVHGIGDDIPVGATFVVKNHGQSPGRWTLAMGDGRTLELSHDQADIIQVERA